MSIEMRKRPVIEGKDALKFLIKAEENKQLLLAKTSQAMKKWNEQVREPRD